MNRRTPYLFGAGIFLLAMIFSRQEKKINVWMIGDSTMCYYEPSRAPLTGWGIPFARFFDSTVIVKNHARGGRSTRTFISEGRWKKVADSLEKGDFLLIQFGHNDGAKEEKYKDRYTSVDDYKKNLAHFISITRSKNAIPVLITPVTRMKFDKSGNTLETHPQYAEAVCETGRKMNVPVIDLNKSSRQLLQKLGPEMSKSLYMHLDTLEHPNYPAGQKDNTHFNEYGARRIAELVYQALHVAEPELAEHFINPPVK